MSFADENEPEIEIQLFEVVGTGIIGGDEPLGIELWDINGNKLAYINTTETFIQIPTTNLKTDYCVLKVKINETDIYSNILATSR